MRIYYYTEIQDRIIECPTCPEKYWWDAQDLNFDPSKPEYYYLECPHCHEQMWLCRNEYLDNLYKSKNNDTNKA